MHGSSDRPVHCTNSTHLAAMCRFNLDKWAVLRVHRRPPLYGSGLFDAFDETFAILVLGHIAMFTYLLGVAGGADPTSTIGFSPFRPYCWPMFVTFLLAALVTVGKLAIACLVTGPDVEDADDAPTFSDAYQRGLICNDDDDYVMQELEVLQVRAAGSGTSRSLMTPVHARF